MFNLLECGANDFHAMAWGAGEASRQADARDAAAAAEARKLKLHVRHLCRDPDGRGAWLRLYCLEDDGRTLAPACDVLLTQGADGAPCLCDSPGARALVDAHTASPAGVAFVGFGEGAAYVPAITASLAAYSPLELAPNTPRRETWGEILW